MKSIVFVFVGMISMALAGCTGGSSVNNAENDGTGNNTTVNSTESPKESEGTAKVDEAKAFNKSLKLLGVTFVVESANTASGNKVKITTTGLSGSNEPMETDVDGIVTGAEVGDLNIDQSPEVYIYVKGNDPQKHGSVIGYSANNKKSLSMVSVPEIASGSKEAKGYRGGDEFAIVESTLVRRFPVFKDGDADDKPTGGTRQLQYKLKPGEASWQLVVDKVVEY